MNLIEAFLDQLSNTQTRRAYRKDLLSFFEEDPPREEEVTSLAPGDVQSHLRTMGERGRSESTQRRWLSALRSFFDWLIEQDVAEMNPARDPEITVQSSTSESEGQSLLSKEEVRHLISSAGKHPRTGPRDQALILTIVYAALRRSEIVTMSVEDVRPLGRHWIIDLQPEGTTKGGYVWIPEIVVEAIDRVKTHYGINEGPLWRSLSNRNRGERMTPDAIYKVVRRSARQAGFGAVTVESLRQTGLHLALNSGATLREVQVHARLQSTRSLEGLADSENQEKLYGKSDADLGLFDW